MCISTLRILANPISNTPLPCVLIQSESNCKGSFGNIFSINQSGRPGRLRTYKVVTTDPKSTLNGLEGLIRDPLSDHRLVQRQQKCHAKTTFS